MMSADRKHIIVGLFVLGGLMVFALLIIWFQGIALMLRGGYTVKAHLPNSEGIRSGKRVHMDGIEIGEVKNVVTALPKDSGVYVIMKIEPKTRIPKDARCVVQLPLAGDPILDFKVTKESTDYLPTDGSASIEGYIEPFIPKSLVDDLSSGLAKLGKMADDLKDMPQVLANLKELTEPRTLEDLKADKTKKKNLSTGLAQFEITAKSLQDLAESPDTKKLLANAAKSAEQLTKTLEEGRETLAAIKTTAETYTDLGMRADGLIANANEMMEKITEDAQKAHILLNDLNGVVSDVQSGKGTLGQLITNDELHRELTNLVENLNTMVKDVDRLVILWRHKGIIWGKEK